MTFTLMLQSHFLHNTSNQSDICEMDITRRWGWLSFNRPTLIPLYGANSHF